MVKVFSAPNVYISTLSLLFMTLNNNNLPGLSTVAKLIGLGQTMCSPTKEHMIYASYTLAIACIVTGRKAETFTVVSYSNVVSGIWK